MKNDDSSGKKFLSLFVSLLTDTRQLTVKWWWVTSRRLTEKIKPSFISAHFEMSSESTDIPLIHHN